MIQFLNIAGLGPIFGAIMGAKFGSASYLWIVFGSIFAGAVHDYFAGMLSLRHDGESLPEIIGRYLGVTTKQVMRGFTVILMILVGAVFVAGPGNALRESSGIAGSVGRVAEHQSRCFRAAYISHYVRQHRMRRNQRFSCYAKPVDGTLHDE